MLNSAALKSGDSQERCRVQPADDRRPVGESDRHTRRHRHPIDTLTISAGGQTMPSAHTYALDRTSPAGTTPPKGITVEPSKGALSSAFPLGPQG
jgi:hypothetical protein